MAETKLGLTIYLLRPDQVTAFEADIKPGRDVRVLAEPLDGEFIPLPSATGEPAWVEVVRGALQNSAGLALTSQSPAGLLIVRRGPNTFVLSFGHAWQKLENRWLQIDFGLRVALNTIPRDKLIGVRVEQVFAKWHIASERAPRASFVGEFGVEFDRDLVGSLEGLSSHKILGKTVRGGTSLRVQVPFAKLGQVLDKAAVLFRSTHYKKGWPEGNERHAVLQALPQIRAGGWRFPGACASARSAPFALLHNGLATCRCVRYSAEGWTQEHLEYHDLHPHFRPTGE